MTRRDISQLAIYQIKKETEFLPLHYLHNLYLDKTADVIYITIDEKMYGIVSVKEALIYNDQGKVEINRNYMVLCGYNIIKAKDIFQRNRRIHKIPVVNEKGELLGDYSCWDDILYIEQNLDRLMQEKIMKKLLYFDGILYVVEPVKEKRNIYMRFIEYLNKLQVRYAILSKEHFMEKLHEQSVYIFVDEDEKRGTMCLYGINPGIYNEYDENTLWYDVFSYTDKIVNITTYKRMLSQLEKESYWKDMRINIPEKLSCRKIDDKAICLLSAIQKKGIKCFCLLYENEKKESVDYWERFDKKLHWRLKNSPISLMTPWSKGEENLEFYGELYKEEDYKKGVAQEEIINGVRSFEYKVKIGGKYFNARNGRRITCFQPENYIGTVYLMGMCMVVGRHVEDQYTISSYLQRILLEKGYDYRVENCGVVSRRDAALDSWIEKINGFQPNDIIIYQSSVGQVIDLPCISTRKIFEKHQIPTEWVMDTHGHCNHKVNKLLADNIFDMILNHLSNKKMEFDNYELIQINIHDIMQDYVQCKYMERYFSYFNYERYNTIGAIVMNCDPFNKGHRYLIEQARKYVECLIIFVVEESRTQFNFEERFKMVEDGVSDLENIIVVPNGDFIFSMNNFSEYYVRRENEMVAINADYDINFFVDYIVGPLHITHRFAGEESRNDVMKVYNETMKRILPQRGITYMEIPKMTMDGEFISSSNIRRYLKKKEYDKAFKMMTKPARQYLAGQLGVVEKEII